MPSLRWLIGDLKTGKVATEAPLVGSRWQVDLDDAGSMSGTLQLADAEVAALAPLCAPARAFLAAAWVADDGTETILQAGPIWSHTYQRSTKTLQIGAAGVWSYYDHRKVIPVLAPTDDPATKVTTYTGVTLGTLAKRLVELAHTHTAGSLPIVLPADETGTVARTYPGYELATVGQRLRDLTREDGGPEVAFVPRRKASDPRFIEWAMQIGTATQPFLVQPGADWIWDATPAAGTVLDLAASIDGSQMASRAWASGSGYGESRLMTWADDPTLTGLGYPLLEAEDAGHESIEDLAVITGYAGRLALTSRSPWQTITLTLGRDGWPSPGQYQPGHWATIVVPDDDPYLRPGPQRCRIVSMSAGDNCQVAVQFQPTLA